MTRTVLVVLSIAVLAVGVGCIYDAAERGARQGARERIGEEIEAGMMGGGTRGPEARAYLENLRFEFRTLQNEGAPGKVDVVGTVHNNGDRAVTFLNLAVYLKDDNGVALGSGSDFVAHSLTIGENNAPIPPHTAKTFTIHLTGVQAGWTLKHTGYWVIDVAVK